MTEVCYIHNRYARDEITHKSNPASIGVRCYRASPFTLMLQVLTETGKQARMANVPLSRKQAQELAEYLIDKSAELEEERQ